MQLPAKASAALSDDLTGGEVANQARTLRIAALAA
jgi:hypothetical protein